MRNPAFADGTDEDERHQDHTNRLLLLAGAEATILTLSCEGTATQLMSSEKKVKPIAKMGLLVDVSKRTIIVLNPGSH